MNMTDEQQKARERAFLLYEELRKAAEICADLKVPEFTFMGAIGDRQLNKIHTSYASYANVSSELAFKVAIFKQLKKVM